MPASPADPLPTVVPVTPKSRPTAVAKAPTAAAAPDPEVSVVIPVLDEAENIEPLTAEIHAALTNVADYEIVFVDDGSSDETPDMLHKAALTDSRLRRVRHRTPCGQSAAIATGVRSARGAVIVTLDGDGQNDPADIPRLLAMLGDAETPDLLMVAGHRAHRRDSRVKKLSSRIANGIRSRLLGDATPDTGCGLKVFTRAAFLDMPRFDHMHRFLPALMIRRGGRVISVPVNHRHRSRGRSKYGTLDRLMVGITDLLGVMWLQRRSRLPHVESEE